MEVGGEGERSFTIQVIKMVLQYPLPYAAEERLPLTRHHGRDAAVALHYLIWSLKPPSRDPSSLVHRMRVQVLVRLSGDLKEMCVIASCAHIIYMN
jgi:hypothetical protein